MDKNQAKQEKEALEKRMAELDQIISKEDSPKDISDQINTMDDVYKLAGVNPQTDLPDVSRCLDRLKKTTISGYNLMLLYDLLNGDWVADPTNKNEYRIIPWVQIVVDKSKPSGFGFSDAGFNDRRTITRVAARLYLRKSEHALFVIRQFPDLLADYLCG